MILNKDDLPFRTCIGMGPNYWRSFDGIEFLFPGRCAYTLLDSDLIKVTVKMVDCYSFAKCRKVGIIRPINVTIINALHKNHFNDYNQNTSISFA